MKAQQVLEAVMAVVSQDLSRGAASRIGFFLKGNMKGGWEAWLQAECAIAIDAAIAKLGGTGRYAVRREVGYGGAAGGKRADLLFEPAAGGAGAGGPGAPALAGAKIWIEFKTQRDSGYAGTLADFRSDMDKLRAEAAATDVAVALAILVGDPTIDDMLRKLDRPGGTTLGAVIFRGGGGAAETWATSSKPTAVADFVVLWWKNS